MFCLLAVLLVTTQAVKIGIAKKNLSVPIGVPLAGYNHGDRRVPYWPLPEPRDYTTFMMPSIGFIEPLWARSLFVDDEQGNAFAVVSIDAIGADGGLFEVAKTKAVAMGLKTPQDNIILSASHSHSAFGAVSLDRLWELAPATDLNVPAVRDMVTTMLAEVMVEGERAMKTGGTIALGGTMLANATVNRRANISPYVNRSSIDPNVGVWVARDADHNVAVLWNFAIHGVCYGPSNMRLSGDIMGHANTLLEQMNIDNSRSVTALFVNADAGDIDPAPGMCDNAPDFTGSHVLANTVAGTARNLVAEGKMVSRIAVKVTSKIVPYGYTNMNMTLARNDDCLDGGFLDICTICRLLDCKLPIALGPDWIEQNPRFTGISIVANGVKFGLATMPGEPLFEVGQAFRAEMAGLLYDHTYIFGYSNDHMAYFAPPREYVLGGYESVMTFWGIDTAVKIRADAKSVAAAVVP